MINRTVLVGGRSCVTKHLPYRIISYFCRSNRYPGGAAILCNKNLCCSPELEINELSQESQYELAAVHIKSLKPLVITVYRPPSGDFDVFLNVCIMCWKESVWCFFGGFNLFFSKDSKFIHFQDLFSSYNFKCIIKEPTRC